MKHWIAIIEDIDYYYNTNFFLVELFCGLSPLYLCALLWLYFFLHDKIKKCRSLPDDDNLKKL